MSTSLCSIIITNDDLLLVDETNADNLTDHEIMFRLLTS